RGSSGTPLSVQRTTSQMIAVYLAAAFVIALAYGWFLNNYTNAYAPLADAVVLMLSVVAQLLLMTRRYESWWFWLAANSIAVPLFLMRGLNITALLYTAFWI